MLRPASEIAAPLSQAFRSAWPWCRRVRGFRKALCACGPRRCFTFCCSISCPRVNTGAVLSPGRSVLQQRGREGDPPSSASACCYVHLGSGKSLTKQDRPWHNSSLCWVRGASNNSHLREDVSMQQVPKVFPSEGSEASLPLAATGFLSRGCRHALLPCWRFSSLRSSAPGAGASPQQMLRSQRAAEATLTGGP